MNRIPSIDQQITFLYTTDFSTTIQFYEDILGLTLALDQGSCRIYKTTQDAFLGICEGKNEVVDIDSVIFTIVTQDVDEWYAFLVEKGVNFQKPPTLNPRYQIYHCFLRDPNGYLIEIQRFEDPRWNPD